MWKISQDIQSPDQNLNPGQAGLQTTQPICEHIPLQTVVPVQ
jgi:hypothetical protein